MGPLIAILNNTNQNIRKNAVVSLKQITNQDFGKIKQSGRSGGRRIKINFKGSPYV